MADGTLIFLHPADGTGRLVFGDTGDAPVVPDAHIELDAEFANDLPADVGMRVGRHLAVDAEFVDDMPASIGLVWDANVWRDEMVQCREHWQDATHASHLVAERWQEGERITAASAEHWQDATATVASTAARWQEGQRLHASVSTRWQDATELRHLVAERWQEGERLRSTVSTRWQDAAELRHLVREHWQEQLRLRHLARTHWQDASELRRILHQHSGPAIELRIGLSTHWQDASRPPAGRSTLKPPDPPQPEPCYDPATLGTLIFGEPWVAGDGRLVFVCVRKGEPEPPGAPLYILPASFYMSVHDLRAFVLPSMEEIPIYGVALTDAEGSFCRTFTATAPVEVEDALQPSGSTPVLVRIELDGLAFDYMIDRPQIDDGFGDRVLRFGGRSPTAAVARPWARESQRLSSAARNAQQLALEALEYTGVGLDWGIVDWLIAAGAWSHSGTPLQAVQTLAEAAGGYVLSARTGAELLVRHPYPDFNGGSILGLPWNWYQSGVVPDVELAADVVDTLSRTWTHGGDINGVWLSGVSQGIQSHYKRSGTPGNNLAAPVTDPLILSSDVARWRGRSIVAAGGLKQSVTISAPIITGSPTSPGILERGQLVQINHYPPWRARVREVNVAAEFGGEVRQTVRLERHMEVAP